jgi:hypothetical protein
MPGPAGAVGEPSADSGGYLSYSIGMDQNLRGRAGQPPSPRPHPPKPSPATYWRRRAIVLGVAIGLVTTLSWAVNGLLVASSSAGQAGPPGATGAANSAPPRVSNHNDRPEPSPSPRPDPTPARHRDTGRSHSSGRALACTSGGVTLSLSSPQGWYQSGTTPQFTVRARASKSQPCRFNMGAKFVSVVVARGDRRIWSSADCVSGAGSKRVVLTSHTPAVLRTTWDRKFSSPGCTDARHLVLPGEYQVIAVAGNRHSKTVNVVLGAKGASGP